MKKLLFILLLFPSFCFSQVLRTIGIGPAVNGIPVTITNFTSVFFPPPISGTVLNIVSDAALSGANGRISLDVYNNTTFTGPIYHGRRARGTANVPTAVIADDVIAAFGGDGYGTTGYHNISIGSIGIRSAGTMTDASAPTYMAFYTTPVGAIVSVERMRIKPDGTLNISGLNSSGFMQTNLSGDISTAALTSGNITTALGYTPQASGSYVLTTDTATMLSPYLRSNIAASTYATITNLGLKAPLASPTFTGTVSGVTATMVGLGNVSNNAQLTIANNLSDLNSAVTALTNLGGTTVGKNIFSLTNPGAVTFLKISADNTVSTRSAAQMLSDIGAQASGSYLTTANNLSDLANAGTARTNLGLGTLATQNGTFSGTSSGTNTGDQTITLTGDVTGTGSGTFATTIGALKVTNGMLAGSIAYSKLSLTGAILNTDLAGSITASKLVGSDIATVGTIGIGTWQAGVIGSTYGGTGINNAGRTLTISTNSGTINFSGASKTLTVPLDASVSGTNTGDQTSVSGNAGTATALATPRTIGITGDGTWSSGNFDGTANVSGALTVTKINGTSLSALATGILKNTTATGVPSIAVAGDFPTLNQNTSGNAGTATVLATPRAINGVNFDGSAAITVTAAAGTLTGNTLNSTVTNSSLTQIGTITTGGLGTGAVIGGVTMTLGSDASYDLYYRNSSGVLTRLPNGTTGQVLGATTGAAPSWGTVSGSGQTFQQTLATSALRLF